jgi:cytochrome c
MRRAALLLGLLALAGCGGGHHARLVPGGDADNGKKLIVHFGCGRCHTIGGVADADGKVGPPLQGIGERQIVAGKLPNTPQGIEHWIMHPQQVWPGNAMPDLGVRPDQARDIAAYLYSQ